MSGNISVPQTTYPCNGLVTAIRSRLYQGTGLQPLFNPIEVPKEIPRPLVVDLTRDVANVHRIYHRQTKEIRSLLSQADAIVVDTKHMAELIGTVIEPGLIEIIPFGYSPVWSEPDDGLTVGLMHYTDEQITCNHINQELLKQLEIPLLVFGRESLAWLRESDQVIGDFDSFCRKIDILLLPGDDKISPSLTLPLSVMMSGTAMVATPSYADLTWWLAFLLEKTTAGNWDSVVNTLRKKRRWLQSLKGTGQEYARSVCDQGQQAVTQLARRLFETHV